VKWGFSVACTNKDRLTPESLGNEDISQWYDLPNGTALSNSPMACQWWNIADFIHFQSTYLVIFALLKQLGLVLRLLIMQQHGWHTAHCCLLWTWIAVTGRIIT